jgi:hypothetical protein
MSGVLGASLILEQTFQAYRQKVDYQIELHRGGKRILKATGHIPLGLWPLILARSSLGKSQMFSSTSVLLYVYLGSAS